MSVLHNDIFMTVSKKYDRMRFVHFYICTSPMMIHKIIPSVDYNEWSKRLDTQLNETANQNSTKVVEPTNKKTCNK